MTRAGDQALERSAFALEESDAAGHFSAPGERTGAGAVVVLPRRGRQGSRRPLLLARKDDRWDAEAVADHLMACRGQMVFGLRHRSPWAGVDLDTLESCFGAAAALVVELAATGKRPDWRTAEDLEKAQIAAYRNQVRDHWKHVNAQARAGDRLAVAFDPERHAAPDAQLERLFAQPDVIEARRDLLAEMDDPGLRAFWSVLLEERLTFNAAGERLGLTKPQIMTRTRAGRTVLFAYLERRDSGDLCVTRGLDVAAWRAGSSDAAVRERAEAHLETCYACSLVHAPRTSALARGMLGLTPVGLLLRLSTRFHEAATGSAARWADAGAGLRLVAGGLAAAALAGSAAGIEAATQPEGPGAPSVTGAPAVTPRAPALPGHREIVLRPGRFGLPAPAPATAAVHSRTTRTTARPRRTASGSGEPRAQEQEPNGTAPVATPAPTVASVAPREPEFDFERGRQTPPRTSSTSPAAAEFAGP